MYIPQIIYPYEGKGTAIEEFDSIFSEDGTLLWGTVYADGFPFESTYAGTKWIPAKEAEEMYFIEEVDYGFCYQTWLEVEMGDF